MTIHFSTLYPTSALLAVLYFPSFHIYFSVRLDFSSSPLSAPGSPRMHYTMQGRGGWGLKKNSGCSSRGKSRRRKCLKTLAFPFPLPSKALLAPSTSAKKLNPHGVFSIRRWSWGSIGICHDIALLCACIG